MAKASADEDNIADIQTFSQVIDFDSEENVSYFSDLWRGDPPMARRKAWTDIWRISFSSEVFSPFTFTIVMSANPIINVASMLS
jgi:hypothetical protein